MGAMRLPNHATIRSVRRHVPLYVGICVSPIAANIVAPAQHKNRPRKQKPRVSGALTGATEGLAGAGGPLSLK